MKKSISCSVVTAAVTLVLSLLLTGCGGSSGSAAGGGQADSGPSEELRTALDGLWISEDGYALRLDGSIDSYDLRMPSGRVGSSNYSTSGAPDEYRIFYVNSYYQLQTEDGNLTIVPSDPSEEDPDALCEQVFTRDDSASVDFSFDLDALNGTWKADDASLTLDIGAMEYRLTTSSSVGEGTINNDEDGRGWHINYSYYDSETEAFIEDPAFLVPDADGRLHLEGKDPELAQFTFVREGAEADLSAVRDLESQQSMIHSTGAWLDEAGNGLKFEEDEERYILRMANGRCGTGRLSFNSERGTYEIFFNGADYALTPSEDDFDVMYVSLVGGTPAGDGESLDNVRFTNDMFAMLYEEQISFMHGSWADDAGFSLNIVSLHDDEPRTFDYVSPEGSDSGTLGNDNDGMGWYIPWSGDSDGKAYLIHDGYGSDAYIKFDTDDPALAAVTLSPKKE